MAVTKPNEDRRARSRVGKLPGFFRAAISGLFMLVTSARLSSPTVVFPVPNFAYRNHGVRSSTGCNRKVGPLCRINAAVR